MSAKVDIRGQQSGELTAIEETKERKDHSVVWRCRCSCGEEAFATVKELRSGNKKSCGHIHKLEIYGQKFGELTAIEPTDERRGGQIIWRCECSCGKTVFTTVSQLKSGRKTSCGHNRIRGLDIHDQKFGELTAVEPTDDRHDSSIVWRCECYCGKEVFASVKQLHSGSIQSCGHTYDPYARGLDIREKNSVVLQRSSQSVNRVTALSGAVDAIAATRSMSLLVA